MTSLARANDRLRRAERKLDRLQSLGRRSRAVVRQANRVSALRTKAHYQHQAEIIAKKEQENG